jgi:hypothetical protein
MLMMTSVLSVVISVINMYQLVAAPGKISVANPYPDVRSAWKGTQCGILLIY